MVKIGFLVPPKFNEIDTFVAFHLMARLPRSKVTPVLIGRSSEEVSMNGTMIGPLAPLSQIPSCEAVVLGSGKCSEELAKDQTFREQLQFKPGSLIASQCSGLLILEAIKDLGEGPVSTDDKTRVLAEQAGLKVSSAPLSQPAPNTLTAGGCLSSLYLGLYLAEEFVGRDGARQALSQISLSSEAERHFTDYLKVRKALDIGDVSIHQVTFEDPEWQAAEALGAKVFGEDRPIAKKLIGKDQPLMWLAKSKGRVIGFKAGYQLTPEIFYSSLGAVAEESRGSGTGTLLMEAQHRSCWRLGYKTVRTKTMHQWPAMIRLNLNAGFEISDLEEGKRGRMIVMEKALKS